MLFACFSRSRDVRVLVGEDRFDDRVERVVDALRRGLRLGDQLLREDPGRERLHLLLRDVDVGLDPCVREVVLRLVEDRQRRDADRLLRLDERSRVADRLGLRDQRLLVVEVDPLDRRVARGRVRVGPDGHEGAAAEDAGGLVLGEWDRREPVDARVDVARLHEVREDVGAADVHPDLSGRERLVDVAPAVVEVGAHRVVRPPHLLEHVQRGDGLRDCRGSRSPSCRCRSPSGRRASRRES